MREVVGVYHADGGVLGELRYAVGRLRGTTHCGLCDITHRGVRRRPSWDALVARLGLPVRLLHLNEVGSDVADAVRRHGSPVVLARNYDDSLVPLLDASALDAAKGSVEAFEAELRRALEHPAP